ncbi:lytic murein transglycosylase [Microvirga sp. HBU67558]|uniref:lytic murein transglycosylase n=1 Tax=Microvirga TaxID=186650 RepID=UPI001B38F95B|nr:MULTISPECIES: lytic murein transglycosylase [unclassified Microvirga]MBQ0823090.1 lytic murein transglycosylase [Microvirga sp. HBU67558]
MPASANLSRVSAVVLAALVAYAALVLEGSTLRAQDLRATTEGQFRSWLDGTVWADAQKQGVTRETFERNLSAIGLDWALPELLPAGRPVPSDDQRQAEFQSPGRYFPEAQLASLAKDGRVLLQRWDSALDDIERRYGVPREIVVAIWGRESHFGRVRAKHQALRVLATQAFMGRRKALYYPELLAALVILEGDHFSGETLLSSWAGALGQPQLLPSKFLRYAVDADGDGRRDVWDSVPDSLSSIANYLREHGWKPGTGWGFEVKLPQAVSCTLEGPRQGRPMGDWLRLGLTPALGAPPPWGHDTAAFLVMPAGRLGPSFLVSENFYVLKQYNESDLYALFIGHLADRMGGASAFAGRWRPIDSLRRGDIQTMQERLKGQGYDVGKVDGLIGFATRTAIGQWQIKDRRDETCFPDAALVQALR